MGVKGVKGAAPYCELRDRLCPHCGGVRPLNVASCVAFCAPFRPYLHRMANAWGYSLSPSVHSWLNDAQRTKGELRHFARTLVPRSLYEQLVPHPENKPVLLDALPRRWSTLSAIVKEVCSVRRDKPLPDPPPPFGANPFFVSHGPYTTSDRPLPERLHIYHPPPISPPISHSEV